MIMRIPSIKSLMAITHCEPAQAKLIRAACKEGTRWIVESGSFPRTQDWIRQCYHYPSENHILMVACDEALGTYGVEYCAGRNGRSLEYCNAGDPYAATLCFEYRGSVFGRKCLQRVFVGCMGDWMERWGTREDAA